MQGVYSAGAAGAGTTGLACSPNKRRSPAPNDDGSPSIRARLGSAGAPCSQPNSTAPAIAPCWQPQPQPQPQPQRQPGWQPQGAAGPASVQHRPVGAWVPGPAASPWTGSAAGAAGAAGATPPPGAAAAPADASMPQGSGVTGITPTMRRCGLGGGGQDSPFAAAAVAGPWAGAVTGPVAPGAHFHASPGPSPGTPAFAADACARTPSGSSSSAAVPSLLLHSHISENPYIPPRPGASSGAASGDLQQSGVAAARAASGTQTGGNSSSEALLLSCLRAGAAGSAVALPPHDGPDGPATRLHLYTSLQLPTKLLLALLGLRLDGVPPDLLRGLLAAEATPCAAGAGAGAGAGVNTGASTGPEPLLEVLRFLVMRQQQQQQQQNGGAAAGVGGAGSGGSGRAAAPCSAAPGSSRAELDVRLRVRGAWDKLRRSGMVRVEAPGAGAPSRTGDTANGAASSGAAAAGAAGINGGAAASGAGRLRYDAAAPQRPPYRTVVVRAELLRGPAAAGPGCSGDRGRGGGSWFSSAPVAAAVAAPGGAQWALRVDLEVSTEGCVLTRHPLLAAHDRLLRLELAADGSQGVAGDEEGYCGGVRGGERQRLLREALVQLLGRGFVLLGRLYRFLMFKDSSVWCLAVRSAAPADQGAWAPVVNPFRDAWPLLGAAGLLEGVQQQASRAELWASKAVPLPLHGWTVRYEPDPEAPPDPATGAPGVKLTDGAGRASPDLWSLILPAWEQHRAAAEAVQDGATDPGGYGGAGGGGGGSSSSSFARRRARRAAAYGAAAGTGLGAVAANAAGPGAGASGGLLPPPPHCMPVQMRLHHALPGPTHRTATATTTSGGAAGSQQQPLHGSSSSSSSHTARPRVMAKGMLSPDARLPPRTIVLPYSCVKAPGKALLAAWAAEAEAARHAEDMAAITAAFLAEAEAEAEGGGEVGDGRGGQEQEESGVRVQPSAAGACVRDRSSAGGSTSGCGSSGSSSSVAEGGGGGGVCSYSGEVQLELVTCGTAVREGRLNQNLLPLLAHHGVPRQLLYELLDVALAEVRDVARSPAAALRALGGLEGRFGCLRDRLEAGWGWAQLNAWSCPDAHLVAELQDLQSALLAGLRDMQIPLPGSLMAVGVPDHTALLPRRCVVLLDDNGRSVAAAGPCRVLLYRDPELRPRGVLAAWLVPPPPGLLAGWYAAAGGVRSALIMPIAGGESLAAEMAGGDYDGDMFHVITTAALTDTAVWQRLAAQQGVPLNPPLPAATAAVVPAGGGLGSSGHSATTAAAGAVGAALPPGATFASAPPPMTLPPTQPLGTASQSAAAETAATAATAAASAYGAAAAAPSPPPPATPLTPPNGQKPPLATAATATAATAGGSARVRAGSYVRERERGSLWTLQPLEDEDGEARIEQMVHFFLHAQECAAGIGIFHTWWQRCAELAPERGGGVGGRLCAAVAGCYEAALDAKKHATKPRLPEDVERLCKSLPDPFWCRKNRKSAARADCLAPAAAEDQHQQAAHEGGSGGGGAAGGGRGGNTLSIIADLYTRIKLPAGVQGSSPLELLLGPGAAVPGASLPPASPPQHQQVPQHSNLHPSRQVSQHPHQQQLQLQRQQLLAVDERLVRAAKSFLGGGERAEAVWAELQARCLAVVAREWSAPWGRHLARQEQQQGRRGGGGGGGGALPLSGKEVQRRDEEAGVALQAELVLGCRRALLAAARDLLPGRLQLGDTVDEGLPSQSAPGRSVTNSRSSDGADGAWSGPGSGSDEELDLRSRTTLATALYCAVYNKRREEEPDRPARLRVVWLVAGAELNWAHWVLRHNGRVPAVKLQLQAGV
ncbi:hypothetical protein HYH02_014926 [Chlamydomonas schloesseri]|uniref:RDRP core domain-containing protein n=1 Tax=Chlamydomonas schloesseri TaxID=2026947 RepID=A0A835VQV8_9CHLO|nr:hypothetical protein HYH02_014926 [Chlamydomonas schloesseri]|eukprot:KAG2425862.1 hypothetical protein HYH02_014926 [Chlamydomonas schloesseri]